MFSYIRYISIQYMGKTGSNPKEIGVLDRDARERGNQIRPKRQTVAGGGRGMRDSLVQAIRQRDLQQATYVIEQLQHQMSQEAIRKMIFVAIERLAWDEGDPSAAQWILRHSSYWSRH